MIGTWQAGVERERDRGDEGRETETDRQKDKE